VGEKEKKSYEKKNREDRLKKKKTLNIINKQGGIREVNPVEKGCPKKGK